MAAAPPCLQQSAGCCYFQPAVAHILPYKHARLNPGRRVLLGAAGHVALYDVIAGSPARHDPALAGVEHQRLCALRSDIQADNQRHGLAGGARSKLCTAGARQARLAVTLRVRAVCARLTLCRPGRRKVGLCLGTMYAGSFPVCKRPDKQVDSCTHAQLQLAAFYPCVPHMAICWHASKRLPMASRCSHIRHADTCYSAWLVHNAQVSIEQLQMPCLVDYTDGSVDAGCSTSATRCFQQHHALQVYASPANWHVGSP